jgi:hypothetical protein
VLLDHREEIAEQSPLLLGELTGDRIGPGRARAPNGLPDPGVAAALVQLLDGALPVAL